MRTLCTLQGGALRGVRFAPEDFRRRRPFGPMPCRSGGHRVCERCSGPASVERRNTVHPVRESRRCLLLLGDGESTSTFDRRGANVKRHARSALRVDSCAAAISGKKSGVSDSNFVVPRSYVCWNSLSSAPNSPESGKATTLLRAGTVASPSASFRLILCLRDAFWPARNAA